MIIMYTLKGIFPEPKKEQKKNYIKENMKQLKYIQGKSKEPKFATVNSQPTRGQSASATLGPVKSTPSSKSGKLSFPANKIGSPHGPRKFAAPNIRIKKGDMAEFLKRKELLKQKQAEESAEEDVRSTESSGRLKDCACQTVETNLSQKFEESTKLTMLYPKKDDDEAKVKASGDSALAGAARAGSAGVGGAGGCAGGSSPRRAGDALAELERPRTRLNAILERRSPHDNKDPYLPAGYQKGVVPRYLRGRKEAAREESGADDAAVCPPGHVTLPDTERKETLRMLRNSFAELVSELNKMPVKTDTLRMRNRKMELEKQLAKLEEGIKVFSRPKVFVKIGE